MCQAQGAWRWQCAGKADSGTCAAVEPAGFGEGMAVCSVWVLASCDLSSMWGSAGQGVSSAPQDKATEELGRDWGVALQTR